MTSYAIQNAQLIKKRTPNFQPKIGIILGSGSGNLADDIQNEIKIPYSELSKFPVAGGVAGHSGMLVMGNLFGTPVVCMQGRPHYYEGYDNITMQTPIRTLRELGCDIVLITNAAASLRPEVLPGNLVAISDHINFSFQNPLIGKNDESIGPRFPAMDNAYEADLRAILLDSAEQLNIPLTEGVYLAASGPSYETPAEIRAFRTLGADLVGMSTVADVIVARHCGLRVAAISTVTNMACGLSSEKLTHENVLKVGKHALLNLTKLIKAFLENHHVTA